MMKKKRSLGFDDYVRGIRLLKPEEQLTLIEIMSARLRKLVKPQKTKHRIMELEGLGAHLWRSVDAQQYVNRERNSWE